MNILHVLGSLDQWSGGPLRAVLNISSLAIEGVNSEVLGFGPVRIPDNPLPKQLIHSLPVEGLKSHIYSPTLRCWCRRNLRRFDGVVLHGVWSAANWTISRECLAAGIPYVLFPHGMLDQWSVRGQGWLKRIKKKLYWSLRERRIARESCAVFFTLQRELDNATKTFRLPAIQALIVVPYGLAPESGDAQMKPSSAVDQGSDRKIGLFLGRVHPTKRPDLLIESWAAAGVPREWRLVIAGPGAPEYLAQLADLARRCRIENSVQFIGPVSGIDKLYLFRRASWFLLPSQHENFGIAVLEAQSSGCAVAVSDQVYLADEFPRGTEILPLSLKAWTRFMRERMIDDTWHDETVRRVREHLGDKFSAERIGKEWTSTILRVLHGG